MAVVYQVLIVLGSLGVFLYGMRIMSEGLQQATGRRLKRVVGMMTANRFAGVFSGFIATSVVQSSSATTVMVVGFVSASLLTLRQAIGVIMGANIGTTVTGWMVALLGFKFSITSVALPAIAIGTAIKFIKKIERDDVGEMLLGFGMLFLGLGLLKDAVPDIRNNPEVLEFLGRFTGFGFGSFLIFVVAGAILTVIVQSSSAAMTITLTMTFAGWIDYTTAAAIILGENIGTTVTAHLAALNAGTTARRAARAHTLFNAFGVIWMAILFRPFLALVDLLVPGTSTGGSEIAAHLAMFHTLFNVVNTAIFIGFVGKLEWVVNALVRGRDSDEEGTYHFAYVGSHLRETTELNVIAAQAEIGKYSALVMELFDHFLELIQDPSKEIRSRKREYRDKMALCEEMQTQITAYLVECSRDAVSEDTAITINRLVRAATELDSIGEAGGKLIRLAEKSYDEEIQLDEETTQSIVSFSHLVQSFLTFNNKRVMGTFSEEEYQLASEFEERIDAMQKELQMAARDRLRAGSSVRDELFYIDILRRIEHVGDFSLAVSESLRVG